MARKDRDERFIALGTGAAIAIREARESLGITQEELARRCGLSRAYPSQLETGHHCVSLPLFIQIADALEISPEFLLRMAIQAANALAHPHPSGDPLRSAHARG